MSPGTKRKRRNSSSDINAVPPEDLIDECRRNEILRSFQNALEVFREEDETTMTEKLLPISYTKKPLKELKLVGLKTIDIKNYFDDDSLGSLDADMFLRFAAEKSIQLERSNMAFQLIDEAKKGVVVLEDLQRVCSDLGETMTEDELIEMIDFVDSSGEGFLNPKHFFRIAHKTNL